jgi:hypothetical protein
MPTTWTNEASSRTSLEGGDFSVKDLTITGDTTIEGAKLLGGTSAILSVATSVTTGAASINSLTITGTTISFQQGAEIVNSTDLLLFKDEKEYEFRALVNNPLTLYLSADAGQDNPDRWKIHVTDVAGGGYPSMSLQNYASGSWVTNWSCSVAGFNVPIDPLSVGVDSTHRGRLTLYDGADNNKPGYIKLYQPNGTPKYIWVDDAGKLRIHTGEPTAAEGTVVGAQTA